MAGGMPPSLAAALEGGGSRGGDVPAPALATAVLVYGELREEALALGIPGHAVPALALPLSLVQVRAATDLLQRIIASRLSSNL